MRNAQRVWLGVGGLLVLGCVAVLWFLRDSEPTVTGTVRLDGKLLTKGSIALDGSSQFDPAAPLLCSLNL